MIQPIIIPITNTKKVNCILEEGIRYCEDNPRSDKEVGYILLLVVLYMGWIAFCLWLGEKLNEIYCEDHFVVTVPIMAGFIIPLIITAIILII